MDREELKAIVAMLRELAPAQTPPSPPPVKGAETAPEAPPDDGVLPDLTTVDLRAQYLVPMIHSSNVHNMSRAARRMNTTIFVKNAPSYSGLGFGGEGYTTLTIATPTGEGLTSAKSFTRARRCVLKGDFRII